VPQPQTSSSSKNRTLFARACAAVAELRSQIDERLPTLLNDQETAARITYGYKDSHGGALLPIVLREAILDGDPRYRTIHAHETLDNVLLERIRVTFKGSTRDSVLKFGKNIQQKSPNGKSTSFGPPFPRTHWSLALCCQYCSPGGFQSPAKALRRLRDFIKEMERIGEHKISLSDRFSTLLPEPKAGPGSPKPTAKLGSLCASIPILLRHASVGTTWYGPKLRERNINCEDFLSLSLDFYACWTAAQKSQEFDSVLESFSPKLAALIRSSTSMTQPALYNYRPTWIELSKDLFDGTAACQIMSKRENLFSRDLMSVSRALEKETIIPPLSSDDEADRFANDLLVDGKFWSILGGAAFPGWICMTDEYVDKVLPDRDAVRPHYLCIRENLLVFTKSVYGAVYLRYLEAVHAIEWKEMKSRETKISTDAPITGSRDASTLSDAPSHGSQIKTNDPQVHFEEQLRSNDEQSCLFYIHRVLLVLKKWSATQHLNSLSQQLREGLLIIAPAMKRDLELILTNSSNKLVGGVQLYADVDAIVKRACNAGVNNDDKDAAKYALRALTKELHAMQSTEVDNRR